MVTHEDSLPVSAEQQLQELGIKLPSPPEPFGTYVGRSENEGGTYHFRANGTYYWHAWDMGDEGSRTTNVHKRTTIIEGSIRITRFY